MLLARKNVVPKRRNVTRHVKKHVARKKAKKTKRLVMLLAKRNVVPRKKKATNPSEVFLAFSVHHF